MKLIRTASGTIKISKKEWESIGKEAGWLGKEIIYVDKVDGAWKVWSISAGQYVDLGEYSTDEAVEPVIKRYRVQGYDVKINTGMPDTVTASAKKKKKKSILSQAQVLTPPDPEPWEGIDEEIKALELERENCPKCNGDNSCDRCREIEEEISDLRGQYNRAIEHVQRKKGFA